MPTSFGERRWIDAKNISAETIPPFACCRIVAVRKNDGVLFVDVDQADEYGGRSEHVFNDRIEIKAGKFGRVNLPPCRAAVDTGTGTPADGDSWGPISGEWLLQKHVPGFEVFETHVSDQVLAIAKPANRLFGLLDEALSPATNALTNPATATLSIYQFNDSGDLEDSGENLTVTNRYTEVSEVASGSLLGVERQANGEWWPYRADAEAGCPAQDEIQQITVFGSPDGGTFDLEVTAGGTTETLTFNWDDTAALIEDEYETHSEIAFGDVSVSGGPLPDATIEIKFQASYADTQMVLPTADWSSLTGGTGVAVLLSKAQLGAPEIDGP